MFPGSGRPGDFAGDQLAMLSFQLIAWVDGGRTVIRARWTVDPGVPAAHVVYTYMNAAVVERGSTSPKTFDVPSPGNVPNLAAIPVASGVDSSDYDPMGGRDLANLTNLREFYAHVPRGRFRQADDALDVYELFKGEGAAPDLTAAPWQTFAALPFETPVLPAGVDYYFVLRKRNKHNLSSENNEATVFKIDGSGDSILYPSAPFEQSIAAAASGAALIEAKYDYLEDAVTTQRADTWHVWVTTDGSDPDPDVDPTTYSETMIFADGVAKFAYTTGTNAHGTTIKAIVRTARAGAPDVDSQNTDIMQLTADAQGPAAPSGDTFLGLEASQHG